MVSEKVIQKTLKNHQKSDQKWSQKPLKNHPKIDAKKVRFFDANPRPHGTLPKPTEHLQFNKTPPEETYINRKKTKRRCPTCKKSKEGTNNLQKYQTDDQRKVIYEGKLPKGDLQKVIYEGKLQKR